MAKFERHVKINAPMDTVWNIMRDPATWTMWFPDADSVSGLASVAVGSAFQIHHGNEAGTAIIDQLDEERGLIRVTTQLGKKQETHTFDLDRAGGFLGMGGNDSSVKYSLEYDAGGMLGEFVSGGNPADSIQVKNTLDKLKGLAERRS